MKKIKFLFMFMLLFIVTGCIKFDANMSINMDKSMDYSITLAFDKSLVKTDDEILTKEQLNMMEQNGFKISNYSIENMDGFVLTKKIQNIDQVSSENIVLYDLSGMFSGKRESEYLFKIEKGLLRNYYKAQIKIDPNDSGININDENYNSNIKPNLTFKVKLPYGFIKNNANKVNDKELIWNLSIDNKDNIEFEFYMYNIDTFIIIFVIILTIILIILVIFKKQSNKKKQIVENNTTIEIKDEFENDIFSEPILKKKATIMEENKNL